MAYYNYLGIPMRESAVEKSHINGTIAGNETIHAPDGDSSIAGDGGGDLLIGSTGDNRFWIDDAHDRVQETPGGGIDTEIGWTSIALADNIENLIVHQDFNYALGNTLDNLIIVDGSQWVNGGPGNDVLVGSTTQRTTYQVRLGEGDDVIYNWNPNSQLQLLDAPGFKTAADVRAQMTLSGADTVLHLSPTETLTFRGITPAAFTDHQFLAALDTSKLGALTFDDEFNSLQIRDPSLDSGIWNTNFGGNLKDQWAYTLVSNGEQQAYVAPGFQGRGEHDIGVNPFSVSDGILTISAAPIPSGDNYAAWGANYTSGMLNTLNSFAQKFGYFEMRAAVPAVAGAWPAFWLLPSPYRANAEADIMEGLGATPNVDYRRAYGGEGGSETQYDNVLTTNPGGFHTYGMMWTAKTVTFYYDGIEVLHGATPSTWTNPMAMIVNLAVGGWGGTPDASKFPAQMQVDYVRAYALADGSSEVVHGTPESPVATLKDTGPTSGQVNTPVTFEAGGGSLTTAHIQLSAAHPTTLPPGQTMMIWEDSGAVFGAVSDGVTLAPATVLMAGTITQLTGAGVWLTDGKVVFAYEQSNATGGKDLWDMVFDPVKKTFVREDLGPTNPDSHATFVATAHGGFAVSWHAPDGHVVARGYDEFAYGGDVPGWYGPTRQITGDLAGVTADGHLIAVNGAGQELYTLAGASTYTPSTISIQRDPVIHSEGNSGSTDFIYTVTRSGSSTAAGDVTWTVSGTGVHPADAADFQGGVMPTGILSFAAGEVSKTVTVKVLGDTAVEADDTFTVTLSSPTGAGVGSQNATASGVIQNDDGGAPPPPPSGGVVLTATGPYATLTGGVGNDTINASQGGDVLTGGAGADRFVFGKEPWSPDRITDFAVGTDRLDISALLKTAGYTGSDPVADHYVSLLDDGAGGTKLLFDHDGPGPSPQWANYVIQLDHVSASGLTLAALTGGGSPPPPSPSGSSAMVVFAGQSNMGVYGTSPSTVTAAWHADPLTQIWNDAGGKWEPMNPGVNTGYGGQPDSWGPEVQFAVDFRVAHPSETLYIVKSVFGGTPLAQDTAPYHADWSPKSIGELFDQTTQTINRASAAAGGARPTFVFFGQGEEDANYAAAAHDYGGNLSAFFTAVRSSWIGDPNGKIGFFEIGVSPPYSADVRAGQFSVDKADLNAFSFDSAPLPKQADALHFAPAGVNTEGDNFYSIYNAAAGGSPPPPSGGVVLTATGPYATLTGGAGNDTINASQGGDVLTGGAGADRFVFGMEPWSPDRITDFAVGTDRLDISALLKTAGYAGSDPVADHYLTLVDDGAGGTKLLFDHDGPGPSPLWANYVIQLDHVSASGLTLAALTGGASPPPPPPPPSQIGFSTPSVSLNEGNSGVTAFSYAVARTGDLSGAATVSWSVAGTGVHPAAASDFQGGVLPAGSLSFAAGESGKTIVVNVVGDTVAEPDDGFTVSLSGPAGATLSAATAAGTILNDDGAAPPPPPSDTIQTVATNYTLPAGVHNLELIGSAAQNGIGNALDNMITSNDYGSSLQGMDGNDTLVAGHGADILTGGNGSDSFTFKMLPWNAGHVTDFVVGTDRLDFSALFSATGYAGSDPVKDGYVILTSDGAGGARVSFDTDGPATANPWPTTITTLDHVSPTGLTWAQLSSGGGGPPPPPPPSGAGVVLTSAKYGDTLVGGTGNDTLNAGQGPDTLTGAGGADHFVFAKAPWNAGHVTDFAPSADLIDLRPLFATTTYTGTNPIVDHWLEFRADASGNTQVYVDLDGPSGSQWPTLITTLDHVLPPQLSASNWAF